MGGLKSIKQMSLYIYKGKSEHQTLPKVIHKMYINKNQLRGSPNINMQAKVRNL